MIIINAKTFRIQRKDPRNLILERFLTRIKQDTGEKYDGWETAGYYGKWEDLIIYLVNSKIEVPEGSNLLEQIPELLEELKRVELSILAEIKEAMLGMESYEETK